MLAELQRPSIEDIVALVSRCISSKLVSALFEIFVFIQNKQIYFISNKKRLIEGPSDQAQRTTEISWEFKENILDDMLDEFS
jgi:hypothetical protein